MAPEGKTAKKSASGKAAPKSPAKKSAAEKPAAAAKRASKAKPAPKAAHEETVPEAQAETPASPHPPAEEPKEEASNTDGKKQEEEASNTDGKKQEEDAALKIQSRFRGNQARSEVAAKKEAAKPTTTKELCEELNHVGRLETTTSLREDNTDEEFEVKLHLYEVGPNTLVKYKNKSVAAVGTGLHHLAVEVDGQEYSYGYIEKGPGVFACEPMKVEHHKHKLEIPFKTCKMAAVDIATVIADLSTYWHGASYDMLKRNCCHFCNTLCRTLQLGEIPQWLMMLAPASAHIYDEALQAALSQGQTAKTVKVPLLPAAVIEAAKNTSIPDTYTNPNKVHDVKAKDILKKGKISDPRWRSTELSEEHHTGGRQSVVGKRFNFSKISTILPSMHNVFRGGGKDEKSRSSEKVGMSSSEVTTVPETPTQESEKTAEESTAEVTEKKEVAAEGESVAV